METANKISESAEWKQSAEKIRRLARFPIENPNLRKHIMEDVLTPYFKDNTQGRRLESDGTYRRMKPSPDNPPFHVQDWFVSQWKEKGLKPQSA